MSEEARRQLAPSARQYRLLPRQFGEALERVFRLIFRLRSVASDASLCERNMRSMEAELPRIMPNRHVEAVGVAGRSSGRNERIVVSAKRDGKRHGPPMIQTVAARAVGWRSEMSAANRPHGPAR